MWHRPQEEGFPEQSIDGIDSLADAAKTLHFFTNSEEPQLGHATWEQS